MGEERDPRPAAVGEAPEQHRALLETILHLAQRHCRADAYAIWQRDPGSGQWEAAADAGLSPEYSRSIRRSSGPAPGEVLVFEEVSGEPLLERRAAGYEAEGIRSLLVVPLTVRGEHTATITYYYRQRHRFTPDEIAAATDLTDLASRAITASFLSLEQESLRAAAQRAERRARFLAHSSKLLASSLDYEVTLEHLAQLTVPELADWCAIHLADGGGPPRQVAVAHADPERVEWARTLRGTVPYDPDASSGMARVLREGVTELYREIPDKLLAERAKGPEQLALLRQLRLTSAVIVPLKARDRVLGALTLVSAESGVHYDEATVELAEEVARRAAVAIDNARLFGELRETLSERMRAEEGTRYVMDHAQCLFWDALVEAPPPGERSYRWDMRMFDEDAAQRYLPLEIPPGGSYAVAFYLGKPEEDRRMCDRNARAALESGAAGYQQEYRCTDRRGVVHRLHEATRLEQLEPGKWRAVGVCTDVTELSRLKEQAERLAAIVESSDDAIVSKDLNGIVRSWNQAAERIFGYSESEMLGTPITLLIPPERGGEETEILDRIRRGARIDHFETVRVRKDGQRIGVSVTISPVRDTAGRIIGASKIARDISVQQALQEELRLRVEELALADRRKNEFLAMLAHELRNPLSPVVTAARIIERVGGENPLVQRQQVVIERQVRHMARLLDDLLDVSRITRGQVSLRMEELDLTGTVAAAVDSCRAAVEERQHVLVVDLPEHPLRLAADPVRLEQIVANLVLNAAKYTDPGGRIFVALGLEGASARISVRDTGCGIAPELLPSVFELFYQGARGLDRGQGGLGIGLTLVKTLVELHGGTVEARSEGPGRGSEFVVLLPLPDGGAGPGLHEGRENAPRARRLVH